MQPLPLWQLAMQVHHNLAENTGGFLACRLFKISKRCEKFLRQAYSRIFRVPLFARVIYCQIAEGDKLATRYHSTWQEEFLKVAQTLLPGIRQSWGVGSVSGQDYRRERLRPIRSGAQAQ